MNSNDTLNLSNNTSLTNIVKKDHKVSASRKLINVQKSKESIKNSKVNINNLNKSH